MLAHNKAVSTENSKEAAGTTTSQVLTTPAPRQGASAAISTAGSGAGEKVADRTPLDSSNANSQQESVKGAPQVALMLRTSNREAMYLPAWLASVELYWPYQLWPVIIVLDAGSWEDAAMTKNFPKWVQVHYDNTTRSSARWTEVMDNEVVRRGIWDMLSSWSAWNLEKYTNAEFIAIADVNAIFHTWVRRELLFDGKGLARIFAHCPQTENEFAAGNGTNSLAPVAASRFSYMAEFDFHAPFVVRRADFLAAKKGLPKYIGYGEGADPQAVFEDWFIFVAKVAANLEPQTKHSMRGVLGHWLWWERRKDYVFHTEPSLEFDADDQPPRFERCPPFQHTPHHGPMLHVTTRIEGGSMSLNERMAAASRIIWAPWCASSVDEEIKNTALKCFDQKVAYGCKLDAAMSKQYYEDLLLTSTPGWASVWGFWSSSREGLDDCHRAVNQLKRIIPIGAQAIKRFASTCKPGAQNPLIGWHVQD